MLGSSGSLEIGLIDWASFFASPDSLEEEARESLGEAVEELGEALLEDGVLPEVLAGASSGTEASCAARSGLGDAFPEAAEEPLLDGGAGELLKESGGF